MIPLPESLKKFAQSPKGRDLSKWLAEVILSLDTLEKIPFNDPVAAAVEGRGRELAAEKLKLVLSSLLTNQEGVNIKDERDDLSMSIKED